MKNLDELYRWYENLTKESVEMLNDYYAEDAFFKDPFNEITGREKIKHIFIDMFNKLQEPQFIFIDKIEQGKQVFVTWDFVFFIKNKKYTIHGSSHLKIDTEMRIFYHRDYWDVGEELFLKVPLLKNLYSVFRKKMGSV